MCSQTASHSAIAAITGSLKSFGCGLVKRIRSMPSTRSSARRSSPNSVVSSGARSRPQEFTFWPRSVTSRTPSRASAGDLRDDVARPSALLPAAHRRNDAVGALRVAAHRDLHPRLKAPLPPGRQVGRELPPLGEPPARNAFAARADPVREVRDRAWAEGHVHLGIELEDALALCLRVAAADRDHLLRVSRLEGPCLGEVGGEPLVGLLAHGARVEDDHVGRVLRPRLPQSERLEHALDPLGIVRVHLASERRDEVGPHVEHCSAGNGLVSSRRAQEDRAA